MELLISETNDALVSHGGLALAGALLRGAGLRSRLDAMEVEGRKRPVMAHREVLLSMVGLPCFDKSDYAAVMLGHNAPALPPRARAGGRGRLALGQLRHEEGGRRLHVQDVRSLRSNVRAPWPRTLLGSQRTAPGRPTWPMRYAGVPGPRGRIGPRGDRGQAAGTGGGKPPTAVETEDAAEQASHPGSTAERDPGPDVLGGPPDLPRPSFRPGAVARRSVAIRVETLVLSICPTSSHWIGPLTIEEKADCSRIQAVRWAPRGDGQR